MERYDIAIIGTGPTGLSAAITATIRNKKILLLGSKNLSDKLSKAELIKNYLGLPEISGENLAAAFKRHLDVLKINITEERISAVYSMGDYFSLQGEAGTYEASAVILASGLAASKPLNGEEELLGRGVSYCATCDAMLYKGKDVAVISYSPKYEEEAEFLAETSGKVYYYPMYQAELNLPEKINIINKIPVSISKSDIDAKKRVVETKDGDFLTVDGVFVMRDAIAPKHLIPGLETEGSHVKVSRLMETNIAGCFACGDISGAPYQYIKAAGEGNIAALSAVSWLAAQKNKK